MGLAAALTLSNPPHFFNVTVLEKTTDEEFVALYDPGKAYLYNVNPVRMIALNTLILTLFCIRNLIVFVLLTLISADYNG